MRKIITFLVLLLACVTGAMAQQQSTDKVGLTSVSGTPIGLALSKSLGKKLTLPAQLNIRSVMAPIVQNGTCTMASGTCTFTWPNPFPVTPSCQATWNGTGTLTTGATIKAVPSTTNCIVTSSTATDTAVVQVTGTSAPLATTLTTSHTIASPVQWGSVTSIGGASSVSGGFNQYAYGGEYFSLTRAGAPVIAGTTNSGWFFTPPSNINFGNGAPAGSPQWSFLHYGSAVELLLKGNGTTFQVKVNDQYVSSTPVTLLNDGNFYYYYIPFGSAALRRIDILSGEGILFGGAFTAATDTVQPAPIRGPRAIVIGDSFTAGAGASFSINGYASILADALGWDDVWPSGVPGTGYLNPGGAPKMKYRDRLATDVYPFSPDIVIFTGGINDIGVYTPAQIQAEVTANIQAVQANVPGVTVIVCSPFWRGGASTFSTGTLGTIAARDAIKAAAQSIPGVFFIDVLEQPFPAGYTPITTTLSAQASSAQANISTNALINIHSTVKFSNGERYGVKAVSGTGPFTITLDANLASTHNSAETVTQVGDPIWTGSGHVGATTGYGNSDIIVGTDGTHPPDAGHNVLGTVIAQALLQALR